MRKIIQIFIVLTLLCSEYVVFAQPETNTINKQICETIYFSDIIFDENKDNQDVCIQLKESTSQTIKSGEPMIPIINRNYYFPMGTTIKDINVEFLGVKQQNLTKKIIPAPQPTLTLINKNININTEIEEKREIYNKSSLYPEKQFTYNVHVGLIENERRLILNLICYPIRYLPQSNIIFNSESMNIEINYDLSKNYVNFSEDYEMVIIGPKKFSKELKPLIEHKNNFKLSTLFKSTEEIYKEYEGRDNPEKIKYYIKDCIENYGIKYVMLVGGLKSQVWAKPRDDSNQGSKFWYVPVRYTNLKENSAIHDPGYISDLYYADIYKYCEGEIKFDDWDSNNNNIFAEWDGKNVDLIDHYPDVYIGRLACRNIFEVRTIVKKIIKYEQSKADPSWFNKMIVIGGDSHYDPATNFIEGELVCEKALSYMPFFNATKIYSSNRESLIGLTPTPKNISKEISKGSGFLLLDGHGNPGTWNTHWYGEYSWNNTPGGISIYQFPSLINNEKLPVTLIGGCHNSQLNVTLLNTLLNKPYMWTYGLPVPESFGWWLVRKIGGGSIATIGSTGLGYGYVGNHCDIDSDGIDEPDSVEGLGGFIETTFFKEYNKGACILGETWGNTINNYLSNFLAMDDKIQMKCIQEWILLGDPSLKIGGYNSEIN